MKVPLVAVAAGVAVVAGGCSVDDDQRAREDARAAVETFLGACAAGNGEAALDLLTPLERRSFVDARSTLGGCADVVGLPPAPEALLEQAFRRAEVREVRVEGGLGTAAAELGGGERVELDVERAGDTWHVATAGARQTRSATAVNSR